MQESLLQAIRSGVSEDQLFNVCGAVGGLLLAGAQIPQIYHVTKRQRARDVSFAYQVRPSAGAVAAAGFRNLCGSSPTPPGPSVRALLGAFFLTFSQHVDGSLF